MSRVLLWVVSAAWLLLNAPVLHAAPMAQTTSVRAPSSEVSPSSEQEIIAQRPPVVRARFGDGVYYYPSQDNVQEFIDEYSDRSDDARVAEERRQLAEERRAVERERRELGRGADREAELRRLERRLLDLENREGYEANGDPVGWIHTGNNRGRGNRGRPERSRGNDGGANNGADRQTDYVRRADGSYGPAAGGSAATPPAARDTGSSRGVQLSLGDVLALYTMTRRRVELELRSELIAAEREAAREAAQRRQPRPADGVYHTREEEQDPSLKALAEWFVLVIGFAITARLALGLLFFKGR